MAALCPGVQYGLSSQESFGENKELVFVKLTDSALRTIEEYLRNQCKYNQTPTIQFLGNEGHLSFPAQNGNTTTFNFSVSSTADMEGPGGSFECLQQPPRGSLSALGAIPHKIRVAANDDVYEATRHRMSVLEENAKNKSTREIEMNRTDIGRKVKVKQTPGRGIPPLRRDPPLSQSRDTGSGGIAAKSYLPSLPSINNNSNSKPVSHINGLSNGLGSNHVSSTKPPTKPSISDIARRPIKERMIHMLALRPYKKPELYDRLTKEGLREKKAMTIVLKQIAYLKDNCYHLKRTLFNDVHEDWPFYSESERQILKRRKPENLTPPGSSDGGSSGSGHSPTSTHPGSPPPVSSSSSSSLASSTLSATTKRPGGYFETGIEGIVSKRQRISHFHKPSEHTSYRSPAENSGSQRRPAAMDSRDASNMNPRSREPVVPPPAPPPAAAAVSNGYHYHASPSINGYAASTTISAATPPPTTTATTTNSSSGILNDDDGRTSPYASSARKRPNCDSYEKTPPLLNGTPGGGSSVGGGERERSHRREDYVMNAGAAAAAAAAATRYKVSSSTQNSSSNLTSSSSGNSRIARVSPDSQSDRCIADDAKSKSLDKTAGYLDYLHEYTDIRDKEQRKRYKADFNADYVEYRELHGAMEKVSQHFADLKERLKNEDVSSARYKDIKKQIVREYEKRKKDCEHQKAAQRFHYLHEKLSHIKRLVTEHDEIIATGRY